MKEEIPISVREIVSTDLMAHQHPGHSHQHSHGYGSVSVSSVVMGAAVAATLTFVVVEALAGGLATVWRCYPTRVTTWRTPRRWDSAGTRFGSPEGPRITQ